MTVQIGPYVFDNVDYDEQADVLYLAIGDPRRAVEWDETAEHDAIAYDEHGDLVLLTIIRARHREQRDGGITVTLPERPLHADVALALA